VQILKGVNNEHFRDQAKPQTPFDLGLELSEQVVFCEPSSGVVDSYGYQVLLFRLKTKPTLDEKLLVSKFAIADPSFDDHPPEKSKRLFNYTAFVNFDEGLQKAMQIFANGSVPMVNFSQHSIRFGERVVGSNTSFSLTLSNHHSSLPVPVTCIKESFLQCSPGNLVLQPKETRTVEVFFVPKNLGVFSGKFAFKLNGCFEVRLDVLASSVSAKRDSGVLQTIKGPVHGPPLAPDNPPSPNSPPSPSGVPKAVHRPNEVFCRSNSTLPPLVDSKTNFPKLEGRKFSMLKRSLKNGSTDVELSEPVPVISRLTPTLFVLKPVKNNEPNNLRSLGGKFQPDTKQAFKEFPSSAKDYEESKQLAEKLSGEKLMRIQVGPTEMDFGRVFVNSSVAMWFQVKNDLWASISCCVSADRLPELRETPQRTQVIPSGKTAGFRIVVNSPVAKIVRERISYTINSAHTFHFIVNAEVVPVDLEVNKPVLNFRFKEESLEMSTSETLTLRNTGNSTAFFKLRIDNPHSPFRLVTHEGSVRENSSKEVELTYHPVSSKDEDVLYLEIDKGGPAKAIKCFGVANEAAYETAGTNINLGSLAVGQRKNAVFTVKNTHNKYYTIFRLDESTLPEGVEVKPRSGKICPEDVQKIELEFVSRRRMEYKGHEILFHVRGASPIRVVLALATLVPNVEIEQTEFNFDKITFGNKSWLPLDITNKSSIPAELFLSLSSTNVFLQEKFDCVDLEYVNRTNSDSTVFERVDQAVDSSDRLRNNPDKGQRPKKMSLRDSADLTNGLAVRRSDAKDVFGNQRAKEKADTTPSGRAFVFSMKPNRTYNFRLVFSPVKPSLYDFELCFTTPGQDSTAALTRKVSCLGTNPRFLMEPLSGLIEFPRKIILSPESVVADQKTLTISNPSFDEQLVWSLDTSSLDTLNAFFVTPSSGSIDPQCTVALKLSFRPVKPQLYEAVVPLFIDNKPNPHSEIRLRGEGSFPKVVFSSEEIVLPPTPLNVSSYGYVSLTNDGYQNSNFVAFLPNEYIKLGLSVDFLNGNMLGINNQRIFLKVGFVSATPVSFTARVNVEDDLKRSFSFSISGVSDNSLFTYAPFLALGYSVNSMFRGGLDAFESIQNYDPEFKNCQVIAIDSATKAPKFAIRNDVKLTDFPTPALDRREDSLASKPQNSLDDSDQVATDYYLKLSATIRTWLSEYGISSVVSFPEDLYNANGVQFYELLEFLLKSPPARPVLDPNLKNVDRVLAVVQNHHGLLNFLKENNAMVNTVRPHFLLSHKDLLLYFKTSQLPHMSPDYYKVSENQFRLLSLQSWTVLYLQAIKVFFVSRITVREFKGSLAQLVDKKRREGQAEEGQAEAVEGTVKDKQKGSGRAETGRDKREVSRGDNEARTASSESDNPDKATGQLLAKLLPEYSFDKNSLFNTSEALLLRWLEVVYELRTKEALRLSTFGRELQNCHVFSCAVDLYTSNESQLHGRVKPNAFTTEELASNVEHFRNALHDFGIKEELCEADFMNACPTSMLLMTAHLFKTLPPYLPRSTIEFNCALHEKMVKEISLSNPSTKSIIYSVRLFGPKNFTVDNDLIKLEGKQTVLVPVSFYANTSASVEGKVFLQNRRNGKSVAGAVVFGLKAKVVSRFSMRTFTVSNVSLYETGNSEITITNPFDKDADFKVRIENVPVPPEQPPKPKLKALKSNSREDPTVPPPDDRCSFLPSFFIKQDRLWIRKGSSAKLYLQYLPLTFETHKCLLVFLDTKVGEMQYEVVGKPKPPNPIDSFKLAMPIESFNTVELSIPLRNNLFSAALAKLADKIKEAKDFAYLPVLEKMGASLESHFDIEVTPAEFLTCASPVTLGTKQPSSTRPAPPDKNPPNPPVNSNSTHTSRTATTNNNPLLTTSKLVLLPVKKVPLKDLHLKVCLKGRLKFDYRFYDLHLTVFPKTIKATIEIRTTARVPVTQNIPVSNNNDFECIVKPTFASLVNGHLFDFPLSQFQVKKKSFINFPLKFHSHWIDKAEAKLTLFNLNTNDNFEYLIKAECDEPLSESHEEVFTKAKKPTEVVLKVKNPMTDCKSFRADCDIPDADFAKKVSFDESKTIEFRVAFVPIMGGTFLYSVTFTDDNGRYFWYLLTVHVDSPEPSRTLSVATEIRKPAVCKVELDNPSSKTLHYKTIIIGEFLTGDGHFELAPGAHDCFPLYYFPLKLENVRKKIGFLSEEEGEVWFDIDCKCEDSKVVKLPTFRAELGKSTAQLLAFKNPLKRKTVVVVCEQSDSSNFVITPKRFEVKPGESFQVEVAYVPKDLGVDETEQVTFVSHEMGDWKYQLFGVGIPPTDFDTTIVSTALGKSVTKAFTFRNPFGQERSFSFAVESTDGTKDLFELVVPKTKSVVLSAFAQLQMLVKFSPTEICTYKARLAVRVSDSLKWVFPIVGITESVQTYSEFQIKTKCGVETEASDTYRLVGVTNVNPEETFEHSFKISHKESANIEKWLKVKPIKNKINQADEELAFAFNFLPHKPFKTVVEFVLTKPSGGRWKFKISLVASEPDYFDVLNIVSQLNVRKTIQFRLFNSDKKNSSPYVAYYTQESDSEFMVSPAKGILEPIINDGSIIEVSYLPTQYGKAKTGVLIVETEQNLWRFLVKGMFEKYSPPKNQKKG
jgi:hypothetical protein